MELLRQYTDKFKNTEPIFNITVTSNGISTPHVTLKALEKYKPEVDVNDPLSLIVCNQYQERFSILNYKDGFVTNIDSVIESSLYTIRKRMVLFLENNLPMRSPKQSKIYRFFYRNNAYVHAVNESLVYVYKYIAPYCGDNMCLLSDTDPEHLTNCLAILDLIKDKYSV